MRCIDDPRPSAGPATRRALLLALAAALAGCATQPAPRVPATPATAATAVTPATLATPTRPAPARAAPDGVSLPAPPMARNWDEFKQSAGKRLVAAHPGSSYMSRPPDILFGIPVIETELYVDGTIKSIRVLRQPSDERARDTVQLAMAAIRRAAPYGDMSRLSPPWKWVEVFLFNEQRQFKPRSLD